MIEQSLEEVAEAMQADPRLWASLYLDMQNVVRQLVEQNQQLSLSLLPAANTKPH